MFLILLTACTPDKEVYTINEVTVAPPAEAPMPEWELEDVELFNCMQFEEWRWGAESSCKVILAFNSTPSPPPEPPTDNGSDLPPPPQEGECQFIDEAPEQGPPQSPSPVNGVDAGPVLYLESDTLSLELIRQDHGEYGIVYALPDCSESTFPFGELMDLVVPGSDLEDGIPAFTLEAVIAFDVRPDFSITPNEDNILTHDIDTDFPLIWSIDESAPALQSSSDVGRRFEVSDGGYPKIECTPTESGIDVDENTLQQLYSYTVEPEVRFHRSYRGPERTLPWGVRAQTSTQYHLRGTLLLESNDNLADSGQ